MKAQRPQSFTPPLDPLEDGIHQRNHDPHKEEQNGDFIRDWEQGFGLDQKTARGIEAVGQRQGQGNWEQKAGQDLDRKLAT